MARHMLIRERGSKVHIGRKFTEFMRGIRDALES